MQMSVPTYYSSVVVLVLSGKSISLIWLTFSNQNNSLDTNRLSTYGSAKIFLIPQTCRLHIHGYHTVNLTIKLKLP